jgi:hypothetical protein
MNNFKRFIGLTGFVATLAAGIALFAAIDGASARDHGRESSGRVSSPGRTESHTAVTAKPPATGIKPAATGTKPVPNTKHAAVARPSHDDDHHRHHRHHRHRSSLWLDAWIDQQIYCDCKYRACRKSGRCVVICPSFSRCPILGPVVTAPVVIAPGDAGPFDGFEFDFDGD